LIKVYEPSREIWRAVFFSVTFGFLKRIAKELTFTKIFYNHEN